MAIRTGFPVVAAAALLALACGCTGSGTPGDVPLEVAFSHDFPDAAGDPGAGDVPAADEPGEDDVPVDPGTPDEDVAPDPGAPDVAASDETSTPPDPGHDDAAPPDPGAIDPGSPDPGVEDVVIPGSKTPGQYCTYDQECANGALCVGSELTHPQCNPGCTVDTDCDKVAINANGQCTDVEGLPMRVCLWLCGSLMGGICPGDGQCDGNACR